MVAGRLLRSAFADPDAENAEEERALLGPDLREAPWGLRALHWPESVRWSPKP